MAHDDDTLEHDAITRDLALVIAAPTGTTTAGHPFLVDDAWIRFRDRVPHILAMGPRALTSLDRAIDVVKRDGIDPTNAAKVVRTCIFTAAITAPPDLWLVRHVAGNLVRMGLVKRVLAGDALDVNACDVVIDAKTVRLDARELDADLTLLESRGLLALDEKKRFIAPKHPRALATLAAIPASAPPPDVSRAWLAAFRGERVDDDTKRALVAIGDGVKARIDASQDTWIATIDELNAGAALVPVVLALRAAELHAHLAADDNARIERGWLCSDVEIERAAIAVLRAGGVVDDAGVVTSTGKRVAEKGAGPMGIIEAYHPYMAHLDDILVHGRAKAGGAWVTRGANIAASQDANKESFQKANDALDAFCRDSGFTYRVFIEHAIGRGEATRQRFARPGGAELVYFGADLEDAAIDACVEEQRAGRLPANMKFVRHADIGDPRILIDAIRSAGASTEGAVMIVGNGFHEVRNQTDDKMIDVFRAYCDAGIVLLFTEENALRVDDLLATAWNTYHAGFRYVHAKSGQGLRPAEPSPPSKLGKSLAKSWRECAEAAGYARVDPYSSRSRTVYPLAPKTGFNPTISANHFCVPKRLMPAR